MQTPNKNEIYSSSSSAVDWSNLTVDILDLIIHKLGLIDFLQLSATCNSYHSCAQIHRRRCPTCPKTLTPWLLFVSPPTNQHLNFHDFASHTTHNITTVNPISCVGSSNGFLITTNQHNLEIINPLTRTHFPLPPNVHTVHVDYYDDCEKFGNSFIFKAVVNMNNSNQQPEMAAVLYICRVGIAFAKPEVDSWVDLYNNCIDRIDDILFHKGKLYAVFRYGTHVFDLDSPHGEPGFIPSPHHREVLDLGEGRKLLAKFGKEGMNYLVESPDREILFVVIRRSVCMFTNDVGLVKKVTTGFDVCSLKFEDGRGHWEEIESLGFFAMFVGHSSLCFVPLSDDVKKNCIYFTEFDSGSVGVFDLINRRIEWLGSPVDLYQTSLARAFWFKPSLV